MSWCRRGRPRCDYQYHYSNNVFQPGSSWISSTATRLHRNARYMLDALPISCKICEHMARQVHFYTVALREINDARFENLDTP